MLEAEAAPNLVFIVFSIVAFVWNVFLLRSKHAGRKRRALKLGLPVVAIVTAAWIVSSTGHLVLIVASLIVIAVVTVSYFRSVRFCDSCGRTVYGSVWHTPPTVCSQCGASLSPDG
jgi:hypothetical protein